MSAADVPRARDNGPVLPERPERPVCATCARSVPATRQYRALLGPVVYCEAHAVYVRDGDAACNHYMKSTTP